MSLRYASEAFLKLSSSIFASFFEGVCGIIAPIVFVVVRPTHVGSKVWLRFLEVEKHSLHTKPHAVVVALFFIPPWTRVIMYSSLLVAIEGHLPLPLSFSCSFVQFACVLFEVTQALQ